MVFLGCVVKGSARLLGALVSGLAFAALAECQRYILGWRVDVVRLSAGPVSDIPLVVAYPWDLG
jgi:hypothetical protein